MAMGRVFRPKVRGRETAVWWLDYSVHGKRHRESAKTESKTEAQRMLRQRIGDRESGKLVGRPERVTLAELRKLVETQYALDGNSSVARVHEAYGHLEAFFGAEARVLTEITSTRVDDYAKARLEEGRARATVNNELAQLRRGFRLAVKKGLLAVAPVFDLPTPANARSGFFSTGDMAALMLELKGAVKAVVRFLSLTGWRRDEGRVLTRESVDWESEALRLDGAKTKSGEPRVFPFAKAPELKELLEAQWKARDGLFVFHDNGECIGVGKLRSQWVQGCLRAGLATKDAVTKKITVHRLVHDLRRTAARDMRRAGLAESDIMELCGWETREMFKRYCIKNEAALASAVAKRFGNGKQTANNASAANPSEKLSSSAS